MQKSTSKDKDILVLMRNEDFERWLETLPEWERNARRNYPISPEWEFQALRFVAGLPRPIRAFLRLFVKGEKRNGLDNQ